jgi:hypothetical protein
MDQLPKTLLTGEAGVTTIHSNVLQLTYGEGEKPSFAITKIHGRYRLPPGYRFIVLPSNAEFENDENDENEVRRPFVEKIKHSLDSLFKPQDKPRISICCSYNMIKVLISIGQLIFAITTLYSIRGNQISIFGYAAFGLTAAQYAWMSFVNLLENLLCPQYSAVFLVNSRTLDELKGRGHEAEYPLEGAVGRITQETEDELLQYSYTGDGETSLHTETIISQIKNLFSTYYTRNPLEDIPSLGNRMFSLIIILVCDIVRFVDELFTQLMHLMNCMNCALN